MSGAVISGVDHVPDDVLIFHAGTRREGKRLLVDGGRVLNVVGTGSTLTEARDRAYQAAQTIGWKGMQFRTDIAAHS